MPTMKISNKALGIILAVAAAMAYVGFWLRMTH
jgi:hypothetical protein